MSQCSIMGRKLLRVWPFVERANFSQFVTELVFSVWMFSSAIIGILYWPKIFVEWQNREYLLIFVERRRSI